MTITPTTSRRILLEQAVWPLVWLGMTIVAVILKPSPFGHGTHMQLGLPPCPSVLLLHRFCPGCGMTTSFTHLLHGQLLEAFQDNWFGPAAYLGMTAAALAMGWGCLTGRRVELDGRLINIALKAFMVAFLTFGAWRFLFVTPNQPF